MRTKNQEENWLEESTLNGSFDKDYWKEDELYDDWEDEVELFNEETPWEVAFTRGVKEASDNNFDFDDEY